MVAMPKERILLFIAGKNFGKRRLTRELFNKLEPLGLKRGLFKVFPSCFGTINIYLVDSAGMRDMTYGMVSSRTMEEEIDRITKEYF